jgi:hypothetical protein
MSKNINRRNFLGLTGSTLSLGMVSGANSSSATNTDFPNLSRELVSNIHGLIQQTPFVNTHEHLPSESERIENKKIKRKHLL